MQRKTTATANSERLIFDLGGTNFRKAIIKSDGSLAADVITMKHGTIRNERDLANLYSQEIIAAIEKAGINYQDNYMLSIAGPVSDDHRTIIKYTNVLSDLNIPLADLIEQDILNKVGKKIHFHIINDGFAGTYAEMGVAGALANASLGIGLIIGTGVGGLAFKRTTSGLLALAYPMEIGHTIIDGRIDTSCNCGSSGCAEKLISGSGLKISFNQVVNDDVAFLNSPFFNQPMTPERITTAAKDGDSFSIAVLKRHAFYAALLVKNLFTMVPGISIALIGGFSHGAGKNYIDYITQHLLKIGLSFIAKNDAEQYISEHLYLGKVPDALTNLVGARGYLMEIEHNPIILDMGVEGIAIIRRP